MNKGYRSSIGLIAKLFIILVIPIVLFNYVDTQPTSINKDEDDRSTRSVAIVNEDLGYTTPSEQLVLGQEIASILDKQGDYSWTVVNRSAAEQGFDKQQYDAVLYVPSNFSENVMTFKDETPAKASINYVIQPNLEAKDRQRIHREMANAKNAINHEVSTIYWSYVSQEVDNIREQFDKILEKEIAFQNAMYSFYAPSSKTLANEIEGHKNRLEGILDQTGRIDELSKDNVQGASEAESNINQFIESLDLYKESQANQEMLLNEFQVENKQSLQTGIDSYKQALEKYMAEINDKYKEQSVLVLDQDRKLTSRFDTMQRKLNESQRIIEDWRKYQVGNVENQETSLQSIALDIVERYTDVTLQEWLKESNDQFDEELESFINAPIEAAIIEPIEPPSDLNDSFSIEELKAINADLVKEIETIKDITAENELVIDWQNVDGHLDSLQNILDQMDRDGKEDKENAKSALEDWKKYANDWKENYDTVLAKLEAVQDTLSNNIKAKQNDITANKLLSNERKATLKDKFNSIDNMNSKSIESLVAYSEALSVYQTVINQKADIDNKLVQSIIEEDDMQKEIKNMFKVNHTFVDKLEEKLGVKKQGEEDLEAQEKEDDFTKLVNKAQDNLDLFSDHMAELIAENTQIINEMDETANAIASEISEVNAETFDWEESPAVEYLDGQLIFQFQQGTRSNLETLSELITSLGENQSNITSETEELQVAVGSVQEESDELNNRWSSNVTFTKQVKEDVYDLLGNTRVDGQTNTYVYDYLSNPITVEGQVDGKVLSESEDRMPPVVLFIIILISGLLIGFLTQYYSSNSYLVQAGLFVLLTIAVGLVISIYGLSIYPLADSHAILWSAFTIVLLMACANIVRAGLFVGPFIGWLVTIVMIMFFISPLLNIVVPEFTFVNPISNVYMGLLYGASSSYSLTMVGMIFIILLMSALIYTLQIMRNNKKVAETNEENAT